MQSQSQNHESPTDVRTGITAAQGFECATAETGLKTAGLDVFLLQSQNPATAAGVFTRNRVRGAAVQICAEHLANATARAVIANSGNANCCTGADGLQKAREMCQLAADKIGCSLEEVLICSTGIIGVALPLEKIRAAVPQMAWETGAEADRKAAQSVMTTDTREKYFSANAVINDKTITVGGMVKGSGMIGPDMAALPHATMLAFLTTDAMVEKVLLQEILEHAADRSFNSVTVDGDTSTNDTCLLLANGASGVRITQSNRRIFEDLLRNVCTELAQQIAADGEGATRLIEIQVSGANTENNARQVAMTVANSPLVKTAIFGGDPNWGRIACAAGRAGVAFEQTALSISLGNLEVLHHGEPVNFAEPEAAAQLRPPKVTIAIDLGQGKATWTAWTCDYSYDYIKINAEYHT